MEINKKRKSQICGKGESKDVLSQIAQMETNLPSPAMIAEGIDPVCYQGKKNGHKRFGQ